MPSIAERLLQARTAGFVGRDQEQEQFRAALVAHELPFCVLHVHGPGGVGKSSLVRMLASHCERAAVPCTLLDARYIEPSPDSFQTTLAAALGLNDGDDALPLLTASGRRVLFLDTFELLAPLDGWLREVFLPQLSGEVLTVLAGRLPPAPAWRSESEWQALVGVLPLANLSATEGEAYLTRRGVSKELQGDALRFTHGHPLALTLVADVLTRPSPRPLGFLPDSAPDVVQTLLARFIEDVPDAAHRAALEACALLRVTDEAILRSVLQDTVTGNADANEAHRLFRWLRGLSFIDTAPAGLYPHDVVREALLADLRWRDRDRYNEIHRRARTYYAAQLPRAAPIDQQRLLYDCVFLHRDSAVVRAAFTWQEVPSAYPDTLRPSDVPALVGMVRAHEGEPSAAIAAHWLRLQPEQATVFRDHSASTTVPVAFFQMLHLHRTTATERSPDPAAAGAWRYLEHHAPLRAGEAVSYLRFWMAGDSHQNPSPALSMVVVHALRHFLTNPRLAYTFFTCAVPELWEPVFAHVGIGRLPDAEYKVDGKSYGVFGHDWRTVPTSAWLERLYQAETAADSEPSAIAPPAPPTLQVLTQTAFAAAVRDALKNYARPNALANNPLLRSRTVVGRAGGTASDGEARQKALRSLLSDAARRLLASPKTARGYRALLHTYLEPERTQEEAASRLDLPFNTYRRHLGEGIDAVTALLWHAEISE